MWESILNRKKPGAKKVVSDPDRIKKLAKDSFSLLRGKKKFSDIQREAELLVGMAKDSVTGKYKGLSKKNLLMIVAGLLYLVNPLDLVPDFIFAIGFADDLGILVYIISKLTEEIDRYRRWALEETPEEEEAPNLDGYTVIDQKDGGNQ